MKIICTRASVPGAPTEYLVEVNTNTNTGFWSQHSWNYGRAQLQHVGGGPMKIVVTAGSRGTGPKMWLAMDPMRRWFETRKAATVFEDEEAAAIVLLEQEKDELIPGGYSTWAEDP